MLLLGLRYKLIEHVQIYLLMHKTSLYDEKCACDRLLKLPFIAENEALYPSIFVKFPDL